MKTLKAKLQHVERLIETSSPINKQAGISKVEFVERRRKAWKAASGRVDVAVAFSDEHYSGDVPYLGGNTNYSIEQVAFGLGPDPMTSGIVAGFEGVYIAGQLAPRAGVAIYPTKSLQLADEIYPVEGFSLHDILNKIAGKSVQRIGLLSPREVMPAAMIKNLEAIVGAGNVVDVQAPFQAIKNLKSDAEMGLIRDAAYVTTLALRAMLETLEPGMYETEVAAIGDFVAKWMGCERKGFETMVCSDEAVVTMIGPALNRAIKPGVPMHLGTAYKRDGLTACCRRSVFSSLNGVTPYAHYFRELTESAFRTGLMAYRGIVAGNRPAREQEQALVDFFTGKTDETITIVGQTHGPEAAQRLWARLQDDLPAIVKGLARLKPYTGTHNSGYTECQEFYGAITLESDQPLDTQVVTMLDVALRGRGSKWEGEGFDRIIPGFDYWVVEDTLGKFGRSVENLTGQLMPDGALSNDAWRMPVNAQSLVSAG
jgi:hypothetical protein